MLLFIGSITLSVCSCCQKQIFVIFSVTLNSFEGGLEFFFLITANFKQPNNPKSFASQYALLITNCVFAVKCLENWCKLLAFDTAEVFSTEEKTADNFITLLIVFSRDSHSAWFIDSDQRMRFNFHCSCAEGVQCDVVWVTELSVL